MKASRNQRRALAKENQKYPDYLIEIPEGQWPYTLPTLREIWRSKDFLVQIHDERGSADRMSVCRTEVSGESWKDGITWDELQRLKSECGRRDRWAVEIYPPENDTVNVANMRHLWLLDCPPAYGWTGY